MNDTTRPALAASTALSTPTLPARVMAMFGAAVQAQAQPDPDTDADLVRLSAEYIAALKAFEASTEEGNPGDPLWEASESIEAQVKDLPAVSLAGVLAKARVAEYFAHQAADEERPSYSDSYCGDWPKQVIEDLLRLAGTGSLPREPAADVALIPTADRHRAALDAFNAGDEHAAPEDYAEREARYHATLKALRAAPAPTCVAGFQTMAQAILAEATDTEGNITPQSLCASEVTQELVLKLLRAVAGQGNG